MSFLARIYVTPRADVLDPQGNAVAHGLHSLGFDAVEEVRLGRYIEVKVSGSDRAAAETAVGRMCEQLLANMVVEDYRFELDERSDPDGRCVMKAAVIVLPGSNCDHDCYHVLKHVMGVDTRFVWHKERTLPAVDLVVLPGGFSYGDALRAGAIARFAPVMEAVAAHAARGGMVFGICNGFQMLTEAGLLPGALLRNAGGHFICEDVKLHVEHTNSALTRRTAGRRSLTMPIAHGEGRYHIDGEGLQALEGRGQVLLRYLEADGEVAERASVNGSVGAIAGIMNAQRNVFGMMPHPERATEPVVAGPAHGQANTDGRLLFEGLIEQAGGAA